VELDPQSIERRDFPIARRGYEPASVDAHLRAIAAEVAQLRESAQHGAAESLASSAGSQVQGILSAAEATAAEIVRQAEAIAEQTRADADADAGRTRADAIARAEAHVAAVSSAASTLLGRVESLDGEVDALVGSVRAGAGRLSGDLAALEASMASLYDASSGRAPAEPAADMPAQQPAEPIHPSPEPAAASAPAATQTPPQAVPAQPPLPAPAPQAQARPVPSVPAPPPVPEQEPAGGTQEQKPGGADLDGARLIALNMALNGDSREVTSRYLAEHFQLADRQRLIDEVYAAIEG
jgi:DivIVA domain-containing protein